MAINREEFASQIYLRLMEQPGRDPAWLRSEAVRQADEFIAAMKQNQPQQQTKKQRGMVGV